jgi:hypothetical protein
MTLIDQINKEIGYEVNVTNLKITNYGDADFQINGVWHYVKLTKTGKVKKNSFRRSY